MIDKLYIHLLFSIDSRLYTWPTSITEVPRSKSITSSTLVTDSTFTKQVVFSY